MESIGTFIVGATLGFILMALFKAGGQNDAINENIWIKKENQEIQRTNSELRMQKDNAEVRAMNYARKIKQIEDIMFGKDTIVNKHDNVIKLLKGGK